MVAKNHKIIAKRKYMTYLLDAGGLTGAHLLEAVRPPGRVLSGLVGEGGQSPGVAPVSQSSGPGEGRHQEEKEE